MTLHFTTTQKKTWPVFTFTVFLISMALVWSCEHYPQWSLFERFSILPAAFSQDSNLAITQWHRLFTAVFLHANWYHWAGNMVIFLPLAFHLERHTNSWWFLLIFLLSGLAGNLASLFMLRDSDHYLLGASGAVSGLLGAWLRLFPQKRLRVLIPIGLYLQKAQVPIFILILVWLVVQLALQLSSHSYHVAWSAHIAGFVTGFLLASQRHRR